MTKFSIILLVACTFIFSMCQAQGADLKRLLNENVEISLSKTERNANTSTGIKRDLKEQNTVNEDVSRLLEKLSAKLDKLERANQALNQALNQQLESASQALNQAMLEIHNDNEKMRTELNKLQATCTCSSTSLPSTTAIEPTTTPFLQSCNEGWKYFNGHCYLVVREYKGWDSALAYCENRNSYLIEITTNAEFEFTATELIPPYSTVARFWVGATDRDIEGTFVYQHSQQQIPRNYWGYPQPSNNFGNDCLYITRVYEDLSFRDEWCTNYWFSICEKP